MALFFYNCFLILYRTGIWLVSFWNTKARLWINGRKNQDLLIPQIRNSKLLWMHCASLGEFEQGRPVIEKLKSRFPHYTILITFFSPSGYEIRKDYQGADMVYYLPMDSKTNAARFLDIMQPDIVLWIKYDYWYYYITEIKKRGIPLLLISGIFRSDQPFFKWYGGLHRKMLSCFTHLFVQNEGSVSLLKGIGITNNVSVCGDTRFDRVIDIAENFEQISLIEKFCEDHPVIVAGSTWPEDEEELDHYANTHPEIRFIIAPHEIDEDHLKDIEKLFKRTVRYSQLTTHNPVHAGYAKQSRTNEPNVLIIDNIGMLARLYKYATVAYIGGGFGNDGIHNVTEAAIYGKPVVFGPVYDKYIEAVELIEEGGAFSIENALELENILHKLIKDEELRTQAGKAAGKYIYSKKGATDSIVNYIQEKRLLTN